MADDKEVLREIWEGRLPVCFSLATEEVSTPIAPDPFYLMIPRMTYFPLVTEKVKIMCELSTLKISDSQITFRHLVVLVRTRDDLTFESTTLQC